MEDASTGDTDYAERSKILSLLFGSRSCHLEYIISLMPTRCSPKTISTILGSILDSHSPSISSGSVLAAVMNSLALANPDPLTYARRVVLADYIIDEVNYDASTLPNIVQFIDESVSLREVHIEEGVVKLGWLRSLTKEDRVAHEVIMNVFSKASASSPILQHYISLLIQLTKAQPYLLIRHLSLIGSLLLPVGRLPMRQLKSKYISVLVLVLDLLLMITPDAFKEATQIETILSSYFLIFDGIGRNRFWASLVLKFHKVCVRYLELNASRARAFFLSHMDVMGQIVKNHESSDRSLLSDVLTSFGRFCDE
uniref:NopRA1 domain-containing protein n=1 Tax=Ascaris lumbricoides TaxID=6252 RepID=A0A0M3IP06_ASCLU